jgi:hypothetical protein
MASLHTVPSFKPPADTLLFPFPTQSCKRTNETSHVLFPLFLYGSSLSLHFPSFPFPLIIPCDLSYTFRPYLSCLVSVARSPRLIGSMRGSLEQSRGGRPSSDGDVMDYYTRLSFPFARRPKPARRTSNHRRHGDELASDLSSGQPPSRSKSIAPFPTISSDMSKATEVIGLANGSLSLSIARQGRAYTQSILSFHYRLRSGRVFRLRLCCSNTELSFARATISALDEAACYRGGSYAGQDA